MQLIEQTQEGSTSKLIRIMMTLEATKQNIVVLRDGLNMTMMLESEANKLIRKSRTASKKKQLAMEKAKTGLDISKVYYGITVYRIFGRKKGLEGGLGGNNQTIIQY